MLVCHQVFSITISLKRFSSISLFLGSQNVEIWTGLEWLIVCTELNLGVCCSSRNLSGPKRWSATPQTRQHVYQSWMLQCGMLAPRIRVSGLRLALCVTHDDLQITGYTMTCSRTTAKLLSGKKTYVMLNSPEMELCHLQDSMRLYSDWKRSTFWSSKHFQWWFWVRVKLHVTV